MHVAEACKHLSQIKFNVQKMLTYSIDKKTMTKEDGAQIYRSFIFAIETLSRVRDGLPVETELQIYPDINSKQMRARLKNYKKPKRQRINTSQPKFQRIK